MASGICFQCGKRLYDAMGRVVIGVERLVDGNPVRLHKVCARTFDNDHRPTPVRPAVDWLRDDYDVQAERYLDSTTKGD